MPLWRSNGLQYRLQNSNAEFHAATDNTPWLRPPLPGVFMGQKGEPSGADQVFVLGLDDDGNPRGARFTILKDSIVSAVMDMEYRVLIRQPEPVSKVGLRLPVGHVFGKGKLVTLFVPNIRWGLYRQILEASRVAAIQEKARIETAISRALH